MIRSVYRVSNDRYKVYVDVEACDESMAWILAQTQSSAFEEAMATIERLREADPFPPVTLQ